MKPPIVNLADLHPAARPPEHCPSGEAAERFDASTARISMALGAKKLGYNVTVVKPGRAAYPHHSHRVNEEMFLILEGSGELRLGDEHHAIRAGDIIACPPGGRATAHQFINTGTVPLRYLAVSTRESPEICDYPDSGKFAVYGQFPADAPGGEPTQFFFAGRPALELDYWDGESGPVPRTGGA